MSDELGRKRAEIYQTRTRGGLGRAARERSALSSIGYRNRYTEGGAGKHLCGVSASGHSDDAGVRRNRAWAKHHQEVRGNARRPYLGRKRIGQGIDLFL